MMMPQAPSLASSVYPEASSPSIKTDLQPAQVASLQGGVGAPPGRRSRGRPTKTDWLQPWLLDRLAGPAPLRGALLFEEALTLGFTGKKSSFYGALSRMRPDLRRSRRTTEAGAESRHWISTTRVQIERGVSIPASLFHTLLSYSGIELVTLLEDTSAQGVVSALLGHLSLLGGSPTKVCWGRRQARSCGLYNPIQGWNQFLQGAANALNFELAWTASHLLRTARRVRLPLDGEKSAGEVQDRLKMRCKNAINRGRKSPKGQRELNVLASRK